jgi:PAS domain S-box-containing protein
MNIPVRSDNKRDGQLDSIVRAIVSAARLEFTEVAEITDAGDRIDAIAAGINMLVEELKESVVSKDRLQKSEEKYRSLYEGTIVGKFRVNISTQRPVAANGKVAQMFGYGSVAELMDEFKVGDHYRNPEERDLMLHLVSMYGEVHDYELEFVRKDGTTFWGSCSGKLYAEEGHVEGSIVDISARKRVEEQLKKREAARRGTLPVCPQHHGRATARRNGGTHQQGRCCHTGIAP